MHRGRRVWGEFIERRKLGAPIAPTARVLLVVAVAAQDCSAAGALSDSSPDIRGLAVDTKAESPCVGPFVRVAYTYQRPDGNRLASGAGALPESQATKIDLPGVPRWLLSVPYGNAGVLWVAVLDSGRAVGRVLDRNGVREVPVESWGTDHHGPQLGIDAAGRASLVDGWVQSEAPFVLQGNTVYACASSDGDSLSLNPLKDAHLLAAGPHGLLVLTGPTERYPHAIMGDAVEAASVSLIDTGPPLTLAREIVVTVPGVVEGRSPIWADVDGDGSAEIIVTTSDPTKGARIVAYSGSGREVALGPAVGRGFRWRHQIAVAPFGPQGELELAEVLTPHIGGVVQFYQRRGERLEVVARLSGYSSHQIGSPNLDMAAAGDFDGDGRIELLVPEQSYERVAAIRRTPNGAEAAWTLDLGDRLSTNIATATSSAGKMAVGVGTEAGELRIWEATARAGE